MSLASIIAMHHIDESGTACAACGTTWPCATIREAHTDLDTRDRCPECRIGHVIVVNDGFYNPAAKLAVCSEDCGWSG